MRALVNLALMATSLLAGAAFLEFASRWLFPIAPGIKFYDSNGEPVEIKEGLLLRLRPNLTFRQVSPDFDALGNIAPEGYRAPVAAGLPEVLYIGDSFTFGQGLRDNETFPAIVCAATQARCANLGYPGTGTSRQLDILERHIEVNGWAPREIRLFIFAMAGSLGAGNDLYDTVEEEARRSPVAGTPLPSAAYSAGEGGALQWLMATRTSVLAQSNVARIAYSFAGPWLRATFSPATGQDALDTGIAAIGRQLDRLDELSRKHDFRYAIYVVHPVQDLLRGTHGDTMEAIRAAARGKRVTDTAGALLDHPRRYYFPYDGHLNPAGAQRIAEFLLAEPIAP